VLALKIRKRLFNAWEDLRGPENPRIFRAAR
jgi:hypothetical protein